MCDRAGNLICCDGCNAGYHHKCAKMKEGEEPDQWLCPRCTEVGATPRFATLRYDVQDPDGGTSSSSASDPLAATGSAPPPRTAGAKAEPQQERWVQCGKKQCNKWRQLPPHRQVWSGRFDCSMVTWDPRVKSCSSKEQDSITDRINQDTAEKGGRATLPEQLEVDTPVEARFKQSLKWFKGVVKKSNASPAGTYGVLFYDGDW